MKDIKECFSATTNIHEYINGSDHRIDEGLKDVFNMIKSKFKKAFQYLKGVVAKVGSYFLSFDAEGNVIGYVDVESYFEPFEGDEMDAIFAAAEADLTANKGVPTFPTADPLVKEEPKEEPAQPEA
jgi:hypothetical protein